MLRLLLVAVFLLFYCLYGLFLNLLVWIVRFENKDLADRLVYRFLHGGSAVILFLSGVKAEVKGLENLSADRTTVYVLNHRSIFDILLAYRYVKGPTGFIAKKELEKVPVLSHWMRLSHCLFLDRKDIREGVRIINEGIAYLNEGISMGVFPEGTRNRDTEDRFSLLEFHGGSFKLATRTDLPLVPVTMYNTSAVFEDHIPFLKKTNVKVTFGEPIEVKDLSPEEKRFLPGSVRAKMEKMIGEFQ